MPVPALRVVRGGETSPAARRAAAERSARRILATLTLAAAALTALGLVMVLSASSVSAFAQTGSSFTFFKRQLVYAVIGSLLAAGTARVSYRVWQRAWPALLAGSGSAYVVPVASSAQAAVVATQAGVDLRATAFATGLAARGVEAQRGLD